MNERTDGIHHVTSISSDPQEPVDFYSGILGLRLVKRTVNFDDPATYHLYFGDGVGTPGTILTFFPFRNASTGQVGAGQVSATAFVVPPDSLGYWRDRLESNGVDVDEPTVRFDEPVLAFRDGDGQPLELIEGGSPIEPWDGGPIPTEHAIRGFHGVTMLPRAPGRTGSVLETLGFQPERTVAGRTRYRSAGDRATIVDIATPRDPPRGYQGAGTVHHIAFRTPDEDRQMAWRERLVGTGLSVTPQRDRQYFRSIYFREPGGILFEIATDGPGFTVDEPRADLGADLKLPPWLEGDPEFLEERLPTVRPWAASEAD